ncbi:MAG: hypothetical protein Q9226_004361 [Calogaya cf. arnoldii]
MVDHSRVLELPRELIHQTLALCSRSELMTLCRVCRVLHDLVIPKLYEVVEITFQAYNPVHPVQLILFLRTILHEPQRAPHVRRFHLKPLLPLGWQDYDSRVALDHDTQQLARVALAHCKHPLLTQMITTLGSGGEDTIDAVTPNLRILEYHHAPNLESTIALDGHKVLDCRELRRAIDTVSATLIDLTLSIYFYALDQFDESEGDHIEWGIRGSLGNMSNYKKLKSLHVPFVMLLGWSTDTSASLDKVLPWDLSELGLSSDMTGWNNWDWREDAIFQHIASFLYMRRGYLEKLELREDRGTGMIGARQRATLKTLCSETWIEFEWVKSQYDK